MTEVARSLSQERRRIVIRRQCAILRTAYVRNGAKKIKCQVPMSQNDDRCRKFIIHLSRANAKFKRHSSKIKASFFLPSSNAEKKIIEYSEENKNFRKSCNAHSRSMTRRDGVRFNRVSFSALCNFATLVDRET